DNVNNSVNTSTYRFTISIPVSASRSSSSSPPKALTSEFVSVSASVVCPNTLHISTLPGAIVDVILTSPYEGNVLSANADSSGKLNLDLVKHGTYEVDARKSGYQMPLPTTVSFTSESCPTVELLSNETLQNETLLLNETSNETKIIDSCGNGICEYSLNESRTSCDIDCNFCGNNLIDIGEICDGSDLGGQTCFTNRYIGGELRCKDDCLGYNTELCVNYPSCLIIHDKYGYVGEKRLIRLVTPNGESCARVEVNVKDPKGEKLSAVTSLNGELFAELDTVGVYSITLPFDLTKYSSIQAINAKPSVDTCEIVADQNVLVGKAFKIKLQSKQGPCVDTLIKITYPDKKTVIEKTSASGELSIMAALKGDYKIQLLSSHEGVVVSTKQITAISESEYAKVSAKSSFLEIPNVVQAVSSFYKSPSVANIGASIFIILFAVLILLRAGILKFGKAGSSRFKK
ncbi:MAG: hypothetical protein AABX38_05315, partial [Candidatus Micrarchaeota archaeon]